MNIFRSKTVKTFFAAGAVMSLAACAGNWDVDAVRALPDTGSTFHKALHKEYVALAAMERDESDWTDTSLFNDRATAAANGEDFGPQEIDARALPADKINEMALARMQLTFALKTGRTEMAVVAANAQAMFDCWMQEQEENFQPDDIARCRASFTAAMSKLMAKPAPKKAMAPKKKMKAPIPSFTIYFDLNSADVTSAANAIVMEAADYAKTRKGKMVVLKGHTDRSGNNAYNVALSERRAAATASALVAAGVAGDMIMREGHGEYEPAISTDDGVKNAGNRRVVIKFAK